MTRIDQALRWFKNHTDNGRVFVCIIPDRHRKVLIKNQKINYNSGKTAADAYYTLK